ncbi:MAG: hypothetical protein LBK60_03725 [Verrucomicrobiales bacterium]|nr:hypothetical protein [Verrucomicrobiales bacterium]
MAVLLLIMLMLGAIVSNTIRATNVSKQQMDATQQARTALDALHDDLDHIVHQGGLATVFAKNDGGHTTLALITRRRGALTMDDQRFLAVTYTLSGSHTLTRAIAPVAWSETEPELKIGGQTPDTQTDTLAEGVLGFAAVVQLDNGETRPLTADGLWLSSTWNGAPLTENFRALLLAGATADPGQPKVCALTVAVATVNTVTLRMGNTAGMGAALPAVPVSSTAATPQELWQEAVDNGGFASFPRPAVNTLKFLQRTYSLP